MIRLLTRDLKLAVRAGGGFGLALAFFLIMTVMIPFGVGPESEILTRIAPGSMTALGSGDHHRIGPSSSSNHGKMPWP